MFIVIFFIDIYIYIQRERESTSFQIRHWDLNYIAMVFGLFWKSYSNFRPAIRQITTSAIAAEGSRAVGATCNNNSSVFRAYIFRTTDDDDV